VPGTRWAGPGRTILFLFCGRAPRVSTSLLPRLCLHLAFALHYLVGYGCRTACVPRDLSIPPPRYVATVVPSGGVYTRICIPTHHRCDCYTTYPSIPPAPTIPLGRIYTCSCSEVFHYPYGTSSGFAGDGAGLGPFAGTRTHTSRMYTLHINVCDTLLVCAAVTPWFSCVLHTRNAPCRTCTTTRLPLYLCQHLPSTHHSTVTSFSRSPPSLRLPHLSSLVPYSYLLHCLPGFVHGCHSHICMPAIWAHHTGGLCLFVCTTVRAPHLRCSYTISRHLTCRFAAFSRLHAFTYTPTHSLPIRTSPSARPLSWTFLPTYHPLHHGRTAYTYATTCRCVYIYASLYVRLYPADCTIYCTPPLSGHSLVDVMPSILTLILFRSRVDRMFTQDKPQPHTTWHMLLAGGGRAGALLSLLCSAFCHRLCHFSWGHHLSLSRLLFFLMGRVPTRTHPPGPTTWDGARVPCLLRAPHCMPPPHSHHTPTFPTLCATTPSHTLHSFIPPQRLPPTTALPLHARRNAL